MNNESKYESLASWVVRGGNWLLRNSGRWSSDVAKRVQLLAQRPDKLCEDISDTSSSGCVRLPQAKPITTVERQDDGAPGSLIVKGPIGNRNSNINEDCDDGSHPNQTVEENTVNIFSTIIKDAKSTASKIEAAFKKLFNEAPSWITIAQGTLTYLGPIVVTLLTVGGGAALGNEANNIIANIKADLATAAATVTTVNAATTLPGVLTGIQSQLPALLAAVKVSNPTSVSKIESITSEIDAELTALLNAIPAASVTSSTSTVTTTSTPVA